MKPAPQRTPKNGCLILVAAAALWAPGERARAAPGASGAEPPAGASDEIAARVNGEPVPRAELRRLLSAPLERQRLVRELGAVGSKDSKDPKDEELRRVALRKLVRNRLLVQEARQRKLAVTEQDVDQAINSLRRRFGDLRGMGAWMTERGLDDRSLFETVRAEILAARAAGALIEKVSVAPDEAQKFHAAHQEELRRQEVRIQLIAVGSEANAAEVLAILQKGEEFGGVARRHSIGRRSGQGGDAGWVDLETLWPPLREVVATLEPRQYAGPLRRGDEFLVVRLHERRAGRAKSLEEARPEIERHLLATKQREAIEGWLAKREKASRIELFPADDRVAKGEHR